VGALLASAISSANNSESRPDANARAFQARGKPAIHLNEEPAIVVRKMGSASHLPLQNDQLMSKYRILSLKPALRLEWRGQHGQNEADQRYHCANLADSVT
jgi:hypothetical protein